MRFFLISAALMGAQAVIVGAMSSHMDLSIADKELINTAQRYEIWHALALLATACLCLLQDTNRRLTYAGGFFCLGVVLFCGTLYLKGFFGLSLFTFSAPLGGTCLILGWLCLAWAGLKR